jgi:serine protease Do
VQRVIDGSPAQAAGLRSGDVVLRIGETDIGRSYTFLSALALARPDSRVPVEVWRDGRAFEVNMELKSR